VTTGGMPAGVHPGVYVTPEVALTQQYMNRESQMIPGGMPSGMPSSVYHTPVDATSHSLVNRQLMTSQLVHMGNSQYSPDLFTPTETPYYTARSTCVRINTPQWSTEVIPSSSQNPNDSGIGNTVADQSQGNSQSQKPQDGQLSVAQTKEDGRVTKHAMFEDEKKVLAYDTDATDSEDKAVATDKKSAKKAVSSKKSVKKKKGVSAKRQKYRSRGRSMKASRSRPGHKKSNSSSESQSCDDDDKKHKGQSTSGTRPRQSRSKRRRASRSRSVSSRGDKRRASSSTAPRKRKSDSDKTASQTSSVSSCTESDSDESMLSHSKHVLKPPKFDGKTSFESFWAQFQNCATHNKWTRPQQLVYLKNALDKDATNVLWDYGSEVTESLSRLTKTLKMRFGGENFAEKNRIELCNRRRLPTETLTDLHIDIRRLSALAYPDMDHKTREVISCDYFIDALANPELGLKIRERQPKDLDAALHIALQLEVWYKDSERLQLALPKLIADNKKLCDITQQGGQSNWMNTESQGDVAQNDDDQHRIAVEQAKLMNDLRRTIGAIESMKLHVHTDMPRPSPSQRGGKSQRRTRTLVNCYNCGQLGHIARNCQMSGGAIKKVEDNTSTKDQVASGTSGFRYSRRRCASGNR